MDDSSPTEILRIVSEIRDLLRLMAEPAIAERDRKLREELRKIVGKSAPNAKAIFLMDGNHSQKLIHGETGMNKGNLSTLVTRLGKANLLSASSKEPQLAISIPDNFFDRGGKDE